MGSASTNFFFDAIFVRTPGAQFRTPFHQDEPYWSVSGFDTCSVWMPLVPVEKKSALEFVRGSHRWTQRFAQENFGALTGDAREQVTFETGETVPFPDIDVLRVLPAEVTGERLNEALVSDLEAEVHEVFGDMIRTVFTFCQLSGNKGADIDHIKRVTVSVCIQHLLCGFLT